MRNDNIIYTIHHIYHYQQWEGYMRTHDGYGPPPPQPPPPWSPPLPHPPNNETTISATTQKSPLSSPIGIKENRKIKHKKIGNHENMMAENHRRTVNETKVGYFHQAARLWYCYSVITDKHHLHQMPQSAILLSRNPRTDCPHHSNTLPQPHKALDQWVTGSLP